MLLLGEGAKETVRTDTQVSRDTVAASRLLRKDFLV